MCRPDGAAASDREKEGFASTQAKWMPSKYVPESIDTHVYMLVDLYCRYICLHSRFYIHTYKKLLETMRVISYCRGAWQVQGLSLVSVPAFATVRVLAL